MMPTVLTCELRCPGMEGVGAWGRVRVLCLISLCVQSLRDGSLPGTFLTLLVQPQMYFLAKTMADVPLPSEPLSYLLLPPLSCSFHPCFLPLPNLVTCHPSFTSAYLARGGEYQPCTRLFVRPWGATTIMTEVVLTSWNLCSSGNKRGQTTHDENNSPGHYDFTQRQQRAAWALEPCSP